jgi:hypothetical protein
VDRRFEEGLVTATAIDVKVCASCRAGRCLECTRPLRCECELTHRAPKPAREPRKGFDDVFDVKGLF